MIFQHHPATFPTVYHLIHANTLVLPVMPLSWYERILAYIKDAADDYPAVCIMINPDFPFGFAILAADKAEVDDGHNVISLYSAVSSVSD